MDAGSATDEQKETARNMYNEIMKRAGEIGLADDIDDYMLQHINSIEKGDPKPGFGRTDIKESLYKNIRDKTCCRCLPMGTSNSNAMKSPH